MFGIEALDVVIGMIFIYLLFSLFVTIVNEFAAQILEVRGKELKFAIEQMFGKALQEEIYKDHRISRSKYRSSLFYGTLFWPLVKLFKGIGKKDSEEKRALKQQEVKAAIIKHGVWKKVSILINIISWFRDKRPEIDLESYISEGKITKTILPSEIPKETFSEIIYDLKDKRGFKKKIKEAIDPKGNQVITKELIEKRFEELNLYTTDWFKRKLKYKLLFWGLITSAIFNVNSISIFKTLVNDPETRALVVQQAQVYVDNHQLENGFVVPVSLPDTVKMDTLKGAYALREFLKNERNNRLKQKLPDSFPSGIDSVKYVDSLRTLISRDLSNEFPVLVKLDSTYQQLNQLVKQDIAQLSSTLGLGWDNIPKLSGFDKLKDWSKRILGWIITAIALSMGAPFWFDLLRKVINIKNEIKGKSSSDKGAVG